LGAPTAQAQFQLSVYGGAQSLPQSDVSGNDLSVGGVGAFDFTAGWDGNSFETPPYYGLRGTWWRSEDFGYFLDFTHSKAYADEETLTTTGFEVLEFTDGINTLTVQRTFEYQYGGVVAQFQGGVEYELNEQWSIFGEYKMNYVDIDVDLDDGGSLNTNLITNSINIGAGFNF